MAESEYFGNKDGGHAWRDEPKGKLTGFRIRYGERVDSIQAEYGGAWAERHGPDAGSGEDRVKLQDGETIQEIKVRSGNKVDQLTFITSRGRFLGPYGGRGGSDEHSVKMKELVAFLGRAGDKLDAIAFQYIE